MITECQVEGCRAASWATLDVGLNVDGATVRSTLDVCTQHYDVIVVGVLGNVSINLEPRNGPKRNVDETRCTDDHLRAQWLDRGNRHLIGELRKGRRLGDVELVITSDELAELKRLTPPLDDTGRPSRYVKLDPTTWGPMKPTPEPEWPATFLGMRIVVVDPTPPEVAEWQETWER